MQIIENKSITFEKPMVVLSLDEWREIENVLEDLEDAERFEKAFVETRNEESISLEALKEKHNLK